MLGRKSYWHPAVLRIWLGCLNPRDCLNVKTNMHLSFRAASRLKPLPATTRITTQAPKFRGTAFSSCSRYAPASSPKADFADIINSSRQLWTRFFMGVQYLTQKGAWMASLACQWCVTSVSIFIFIYTFFASKQLHLTMSSKKTMRSYLASMLGSISTTL